MEATSCEKASWRCMTNNRIDEMIEWRRSHVQDVKGGGIFWTPPLLPTNNTQKWGPDNDARRRLSYCHAKASTAMKACLHSFSNWVVVLDISFSSKNAFITEKSGHQVCLRVFLLLPRWRFAADEWMNHIINPSDSLHHARQTCLTSTLALVSDGVFDDGNVAFPCHVSLFLRLFCLWRELVFTRVARYNRWQDKKIPLILSPLRQ